MPPSAGSPASWYRPHQFDVHILVERARQTFPGGGQHPPSAAVIGGVINRRFIARVTKSEDRQFFQRPVQMDRPVYEATLPDSRHFSGNSSPDTALAASEQRNTTAFATSSRST